jgi:hypothetical protein
MALVSSTDEEINQDENHSFLKVVEALGESTKNFPFFDEDGTLDFDKVLKQELTILAKLPPTVPI